SGRRGGAEALTVSYRNLHPRRLALGHAHVAAPLRPPAEDATEQHQNATTPDQGHQWIVEDANRRGLRVVEAREENVEVVQVVGANRDHARRLILEAAEDSLTGIELAQLLAITAEREMRQNRLDPTLAGIADALIGQREPSQLRALVAQHHG